MKKMLVIALVSAAMLSGSQAKAYVVGESPYVEIWSDRGDGAIYHAGELAEICIRPAQDCYIIVYEIDTDGYLRLLFPQDCYGDGFVRAGHIYRIGRGAHARFYVSGPSGIAYIHVIASYEPFRRLYWNGCRGYETYGYEVSWGNFNDYWGCALPSRVYGDPYIAMETIDEFICPDLIEEGLVWADFTYFYVDARVPYPRYVCYDCHGFNPHIRPYTSVCVGFTVTFIDCDPCFHPWSWWWWCSPKRVYCGPRYVCYARKPCRGYPSIYKWKSRMDPSPRVVTAREIRARDSGNLTRSSGVKKKQSVRNLYSRSEPRGKKRATDVSKARTRRIVHRDLQGDKKVPRRSPDAKREKAFNLRSKKHSRTPLAVIKRLVSRGATKVKAMPSVRAKVKGKSHSRSPKSKRRRLSR